MRKYPRSLKRLNVLLSGLAMAIVAPKGRKHLSADALLRLVRSGFANIPDDRPDDVAISLADVLMSAFAMFSLKSPSLLAFDQQRAEGNLHTIYGIDKKSASRVTRICARCLIRSPPSCSARCSRVSFANSSVARHLKRGCFSMAATSWRSTARGVFLPQPFTVNHVCKEFTATGRSRIRIRCWAQRSSIQTCVP